jgi:hypothetical protein
MGKNLKRIMAFSTGVGLVSMVVASVSAADIRNSVTVPSVVAASSTVNEVLVEKFCLGCHSIEKLSHYRKTREQWEHSIEAMTIENGVQVSPSEKSALALYMANNYESKRKN